MITILIIEDEEPIADYIEQSLLKIKTEESFVIYKAETISDAEYILNKELIDLCLLDLNLYGENGFNLLKKHPEYRFNTIVVSAYRDKALDAFDKDVIDFVAKPFNQNRLEKAILKFITRRNNRDFYHDSIFSKFSGELKRIQIDQIEYIEASHIYVTAFLKSGKSELIDQSLTAIEQKLPKRFFKCHRSYLIDLKQIIGVKHLQGGTYVAQLMSHKEIPVSRSKFKELKALILNSDSTL